MSSQVGPILNPERAQRAASEYLPTAQEELVVGSDLRRPGGEASHRGFAQTQQANCTGNADVPTHAVKDTSDFRNPC